jgi:hypothetical protein
MTYAQLVQIGVAQVRALMKRAEEQGSFPQRFAKASCQLGSTMRVPR